MKCKLHEYTPGGDWRGDFYLELEAENMEDAAKLCRLSLNNLKGSATIHAARAGKSGTFSLSVGVEMRKDITDCIER